MNQGRYYPQYPYATQLQTGEGYQGFDGLGQNYGGYMTDAQLERQIALLLQASLDPSLSGFSISKAFKKLTKKITKTVKDVAPIAAAAASTYFGAPMLAPLAMNLVSGLVGTEEEAPVEEQVNTATSPKITKLATTITQQQLSKKGINMNSPQSKKVIENYVRSEQEKISTGTRGGTDWMKMLLPAAAVGAGVFMLTR